MNTRTHFAGGIFALACPFLLQTVYATTYGYIDLNPIGYASSIADGIDGDNIVGSVFIAGEQHAFLWNLDTSAQIDLNPSSSTSFAWGISGENVVGVVNSSTAALWNGSAANYTNLNSSSLKDSGAYAIFGTQIAGEGLIGYQQHALLWNVGAGTYIDLNPAGVLSSQAVSLNASHQVGIIQIDMVTTSPDHAVEWSGTSSYLDLNPTGYTASQALGISADDTQIVGNASSAGAEHAYLWDTVTNTGIDLDPGGYVITNAWATNGTIQIGAAGVSDLTSHAAVWEGSAATFYDLNTIIPGATSSAAYGVNAAGDIVGSAVINGESHAVMWYPLPEPAVACSMILLMPWFLRARKK
ncbi:MAG TPA: hypothetical protein VGG19_11545 [Tepidisphaeraceae bacterium]|jgi:hypothetical protein